MAKVIRKCRESGSIMERPRSEQPSASTGTKEIDMANMYTILKKSSRMTSNELAFSIQPTVKYLNSKSFILTSYKVMHHLTEDEPDRRNEMREWFIGKLNNNIRLAKDCVLFSDEAIFFVNGEVNRQYIRYWSPKIPRFVDYSKQQGAQKVMAWCG